MGFGWIRTANVFNRLVAFIAFTYFLFVDGLLHAAKFALVAVVLFVAIGALSSAVNNQRNSDPIEQLAVMRGHMPPFMLKVLLLTTVMLIAANVTAIWFFAS